MASRGDKRGGGPRKGRSGSKGSPRSKGTKRATKPKAPRASKGPSKAKGKGGVDWRGILRRLLWSSAAAVGALGLGVAVVTGALYRQAAKQVEAKLESQLWELPGEVLSGPIPLWRGLETSPEDLALDLQGAGYARVERASEPGDFEVGSQSLVVRLRAEEGPGYSIPAQEVRVKFSDGRISSLSPKTAVLPPTVLAGVRGADNEQRTPRKLEDFPEDLRHAVLAMEDARFYEHPGVSVLGIARALVVNLISGETRQGGSTLTQQLAKNLFLTQERTLSRKGHELLLALALERSLSKDEILALYLNEIYWGQAGGAAICGADAAAQAYFGKPVDRLSLGESATLAGIISSPNTYSPLRHPERAQERRDLALQRMVDEFWLEQAQADGAKAKELKIQPGVRGRRAPYAVDALVDEVETALGQGAIAAQGLQVHSTIHPPLQRLAEEMLALSMDKLEAAYPKATGVQAAMVAVRVSDGAVVAMVGGRDYGESQYNRALLAERQVGSTVKPLTMLAAFDQDPALGPATLLLDEEIERRVDGKVWRPQNYDGSYRGEITLREAISDSRNIPAVLLAEELGYRELKASLVSVGLEDATDLPSVSLGGFEGTPLQLAGAYTTFPAGGVYHSPRLLVEVRDETGATLLSRPERSKRVASERAAVLATSVLESVVSEGTGARASRFGAKGKLGGKTGTTDGYRDAWFVGFSSELSVAVWVGFDAGGSAGLSGSKAALPSWSRFMGGSGTGGGSFPSSRQVVEAAFCVSQEWDLSGCTECGTELFTKGQAPVFGCAQPLTAPLDAIEALIESRRNPNASGPQTPGAPGDESPEPQKERPWRRLWR
ncbi:MAG: PBP1A family penicillin-binding protein [Myxococcota bacterium]|nr:PBP1A family penicillin-binding protein [Myxococcota bacterium]